MKNKIYNGLRIFFEIIAIIIIIILFWEMQSYKKNTKNNGSNDMKKVVYIREDEKVTRGEGTSYFIDNYITKEVSPGVSVAVSHLNGEVPSTMNNKSDRIYYFLNAEATFIFEDDIIEVTDNSSLFIPAKTKYTMKGTFDAILINAPAFDFNEEVQLTNE